jgi:ectoine hydroxylase-related dioxygenase (phytanoyl-CoA dioxygenase family)
MDADDKNGFAVLPKVLSSATMESLERALAGSAIARSRAGARHLLADPAIAAIACDPRLASIASQALAGTAIPFRATLFDKSARSNWLVAWHQDTALPLRIRKDVAGWGPWSTKAGLLYAHAPAAVLSRVVALRIHLDDSRAENGPLRVLPGTHRMGVLSDADAHELAQRVPVVECLVARGGVIVMRPLLVHASSKTTGGLPRRVVHIEYAASLEVGDGLVLAVA